MGTNVFICSTRTSNWALHLASLEKMCALFFAYNRLDYAQNIPEYLARMHELETSSPALWEILLDGNFTVQNSDTPFTAVGVDKAQEFGNKIHKGDGGLSGITTNPDAPLQYCLTAPILSQLSVQTEEIIGLTAPHSHKHHHLFEAKVKRQEKNISQLKAVFQNADPFGFNSESFQDGKKLFNIISKEIMSEQIESSIFIYW